MESKTCQQWKDAWTDWLENFEHDSISEESTIANLIQEVDEDTEVQSALLKAEQSVYAKGWNERMTDRYGTDHGQLIEKDIVYKEYARRDENIAAQGALKKKTLDEQLAEWIEKAKSQVNFDCRLKQLLRTSKVISFF